MLNRLLITPEFLGRTYNDELTSTKIISGIENAIEIHSLRYNYKVIEKTKIEEITKIVSRAKGVNTLRNKFAHYCWTRYTDDQIFGSRLSGKLPKRNKPDKYSVLMTNKELYIEYSKAYEVAEDLMRILKELPEIEEERVFKIFHNQ